MHLKYPGNKAIMQLNDNVEHYIHLSIYLSIKHITQQKQHVVVRFLSEEYR